ncbi:MULTISPECIES: hypothetical protein [Bacillus cereus group]|nr:MULTISPECIES: hypothetical protein [Bacillus cereus group]
MKNKLFEVLAHAHQVKILLHPQNEIFRLSCNEKAYLLFWG